MAVTETTQVSYGQKLGKAAKSILTGCILFFCSFVLLFWNEGRQDMSLIAQQAIEIDASTQVSGGSFVAVRGYVHTDEQLTDPYIQPGQVLSLQRHVEMYAWIENKETTTKDKVGGGQEETTTYTYEKEWTDDPQDSATFKEAGHDNPVLSYEKTQARVARATIGSYTISPQDMELPASIQLILTTGNTTLAGTQFTTEEIATTGTIAMGTDKTGTIITGTGTTTTGRILPETTPAKTGDKKETQTATITPASSTYLFVGPGTLGNPSIGAVRISYTIVPAEQTGTIFGIVDGNTLKTYLDKNQNKLYRLFRSDKASAVATMHGEYVMQLWILRLVGFFMMRIGLQMVLSLIPALTSILPLLGDVTGGIIKLITFFISLILSLVTIIVAMIFHSIVALVVTLVIVLAIGIRLYIRSKNKTTSPTPTEQPLTV